MIQRAYEPPKWARKQRDELMASLNGETPRALYAAISLGCTVLATALAWWAVRS